MPKSLRDRRERKAHLIAKEYKKGKLHSGRGKNGKKGKIVRDPAQVRAIIASVTAKMK